MFTFRKMAFPTDFSPFSMAALPYVKAWAETFSCELHLFHAGKSELDAAQAEERFAPLLKSMADSAVTVHCAVRCDVAPAPALFAYLEEHEIDLVIMATHGNRGMIRFFLGSMAEEVARTAPCSVLTLRSDHDPMNFWNNKKIMVPTDFSRPSEIAMDLARDLGLRLGAQTQLVHIIESALPPSLFMHGVRSYFEMVPGLKERTQALLEKKLEKNFAGQGSCVVREGHVANEIRRIALHDQVGLIIMPSHGLTGTESDPMGHNTAQVIRNAPCPVLTLRVYGRGRGHGETAGTWAFKPDGE